ncbi:MAG: hypothetical protein GY696_38530 [Gammaproteobacteria bacterium]|nr:hypothetical protein [Gammaproteobacteria bacterium]
MRRHLPLQIFTNRRGTPSSILSDRGMQIVATSKATDQYFNLDHYVGVRACGLTPYQWSSRESDMSYEERGLWQVATK